MTWYADHNRNAQSEPSQTEEGERAEHPCKISDEFARRLAELEPDETVRALVLPAPYLHKGTGQQQAQGQRAEHVDRVERAEHENSQDAPRRLRSAERQAMLREARQQTESSFHEIDDVLARTGGRRLSTNGNAFGYILIETNAKGIDAVSALDWVNTVMEDQPIHPQRDPTQPSRSVERFTDRNQS